MSTRQRRRQLDRVRHRRADWQIKVVIPLNYGVKMVLALPLVRRCVWDPALRQQFEAAAGHYAKMNRLIISA